MHSIERGSRELVLWEICGFEEKEKKKKRGMPRVRVCSARRDV